MANTRDPQPISYPHRRRGRAAALVLTAVAVLVGMAACRPHGSPARQPAAAPPSSNGSPSATASEAAPNRPTPPPTARDCPTPPPRPTGPARKRGPEPTEPCAAAAARFDAAVSALLAAAVPGADLSNGADAAKGSRWFVRAVDDEFEALVNVARAGRPVGALAIRISSWSAVPEAQCPQRLAPGQTCSVAHLPDGTVLFEQSFSHEVGDQQRQAVAWRKDHTAVLLMTCNCPITPTMPAHPTVYGPQPPLTAQQLKTIALDSRFTLFPA